MILPRAPGDVSSSACVHEAVGAPHVPPSRGTSPAFPSPFRGRIREVDPHARPLRIRIPQPPAFMIRFGPAGWIYKDWAGIVYPAPKPRGFDPLTYLAGFFDTIEVNSTFYRPATRETAEKWIARTRPNPAFTFTAKL